jgi:alkanesulfonate monooxygenase SsuD/methylene tetrahydromethanopterin reductase-like flavin-dependent oxidoreductase (luciferase family)
LELAVHLPLMEFGDEGLSLTRLTRTVGAARDCGFAAVSANDHFLFGTPWLDGPTALAAMAERSGDMALVTTIALVTLRRPVPLAKTLAALDVISDGRAIAGVGPGSSERDYQAVEVPFEDRWKRFDKATSELRELLRPGSELAPPPRQPGGVPVWIGSWGSPAGLRRVARLGDGWLASAYNTTPERFSTARAVLARALQDRGREPDGFPNALATMWTWISHDRGEGERVLVDTLAPLLNRDPEQLHGQVCIGPAEHCAELLTRYERAGCQRVYLWPLGDERRQLELFAGEVAPMIES